MSDGTAVSGGAVLDPLRTLDDPDDRPALPAAQGTRPDDGHNIAHLDIIGRVVRHELRSATLNLAIEVVTYPSLDRHDNALIHLVANDHALEFCFGTHPMLLSLCDPYLAGSCTALVSTGPRCRAGLPPGTILAVRLGRHRSEAKRVLLQ